MLREMQKVDPEANRQRMSEYKALAIAFSYPDKKFFNFFPEFSDDKEKLCREYDRLFRVKEIWLYGAEYISEHEFQRSNYLADISGFYRAFGLEVSKDRPDSLEALLEFMHYLIFKETNAPSEEKAEICADAQRKFFNEYISPMAKAVAQSMITQAENTFYKDIACQMQEFMVCEEEFFKK